MRLLELFAGSRSVGRVAERMGMEVFSVDIEPFEGIDLVKDIEFLVPADIPFVPDIIHASPPCQSYSLAAISHHRPTNAPKSEFAEKSDRLVKNTLAIIRAFSDTIFYIENPNATLQYQPMMHGLHRVTIDYCRYGDTSMKPTNIFSNNIRSAFNADGWQPRPRCYNENPHCHHERAKRGAKTGTQGKANHFERSRIPEKLCRELLEAAVFAINSRVLTTEP